MTTQVTTHRVELEHGPPVVDGVVRWWSASFLTEGDPASPAGCLRRLYYKRVERREEPTSASMEVGTAGHARVERYLRTGEKVLDQIELAGAHFIPEPGPSLMVEQSIAEWGVTIDGIPVRGHVDLIKPGREYVRDDGEEQWDPDGTIEVIDWKFRGDLVYALTPNAVGNSTQMSTYGYAVARKFAPAYVRLSHVNFQTRGRREARKASVLLRRSDLDKRWNRVEGLARSIVRAVQAESPESVEPNRAACSAYRGCPHRAYCSVGQQSALDEVFGTTSAAAVTAAFKGESNVTQPTDLLKLFNLGAAGAVPPATTPAPVAPTSPLLPQAILSLQGPAQVAAPAGPTPEEIAAETARIEAEAEQARAAAEARRLASAHPGLRETWAAITHAINPQTGQAWGSPPLAGEAMRAVSAAVFNYQAGPAEVRPGTGPLAGCRQLTDPAEIFQLAKELGLTAPQPVVPPDAPVSDPALAAVPLEGVSTPEQIAAYAAQGEAKKRGRGRPSKAEKAAQEAAQQAQGAVAVAVPAAATQVPPPSGNSPAPVTLEENPTRNLNAPGAAQPALVQDTVGQGEPMPVPPTGAIPGFRIICGVRVGAGTYESLDLYVDRLVGAITGKDGYNLPDIRLAPDKHPLAYGKGKAALAALARANPPPPATYVLASASELSMEVADALRPLCEFWAVA